MLLRAGTLGTRQWPLRVTEEDRDCGPLRPGPRGGEATASSLARCRGAPPARCCASTSQPPGPCCRNRGGFRRTGLKTTGTADDAVTARATGREERSEPARLNYSRMNAKRPPLPAARREQLSSAGAPCSGALFTTPKEVQPESNSDARGETPIRIIVDSPHAAFRVAGLFSRSPHVNSAASGTRVGPKGTPPPRAMRYSSGPAVTQAR